MIPTNILSFLLFVIPILGQIQPQEPIAKKRVAEMDTSIAHQYQWNNFPVWNKTMSKYFEQDFVYDTIYGLGNFTGIKNWYNGEHIPWNIAFPNASFAADIGFIFAGSTEYTVTCTGYAEAYMEGPFVTIPPSKKKMLIMDLDFYIVSKESNKITYNWCMMDTYGMMVQTGHRFFPSNGLPEGIFYAPRGMDGLPAPISKFVDLSDSVKSQKVVVAAIDAMFVQKQSSLVNWDDSAPFYGGFGLGYAKNKQLFYESILKPLQDALSNPFVQSDLVVCEGKYCGVHGYWHGTHVGELFGQKATNKQIKIRFGWHFHVENDLIVEGWGLFDIPGAVLEMGVDWWKLIEMKVNGVE